MIKILAIAAFVVFAGSNVYAGDCSKTVDSGTCVTLVTVDSGTAKTCNGGIGSGCSCQEVYGTQEGCTTRLGGSSCMPGYNMVGYTVTGAWCCQKCVIQPPELNERVEPSDASSGVETAFTPRTNTFFGYFGTTNRSGTVGRATSINARLDVCMGNLDTDSAIATNNATTCYNQYCGTSKNEYCNASGVDGNWSGTAAVCHDRCECAINTVTDPSCNQL